MRNDIISEAQQLSKDVDVIFYFVCPENLSLKEDAMDQVSQDFAQLLGFKLYVMRCGTDVQDPRSLFQELSGMSVEKYDIVFCSKESGEVSLLSHDQKVQFTKDLETSDVNTGLIAKRFVDTSESSTVPEYRNP